MTADSRAWKSAFYFPLFLNHRILGCVSYKQNVLLHNRTRQSKPGNPQRYVFTIDSSPPIQLSPVVPVTPVLAK